MANLVLSPPAKHLTVDRDQDYTHVITVPANAAFPATSWSLEYSVTHPTTGTALFTKTATIVVTTAGSSSVDAVFTIPVADTDTSSATVGIKYNWKFKRSDAGSEVNMDGGTVTYLR